MGWGRGSEGGRGGRGLRAAAVPPFPGPTLGGSPPPGRAGAPGLAAGGLAGGSVHAAPHCAPTAQAAGGTLEGLHAAVPLHVQALQPPALPPLPELQLDLRGKGGNKSHHANRLLTEWL